MKKLWQPLTLAVFSVIVMTIAASFSRMTANGMLIEPGFFAIPLGEASIVFSGLWALKILWQSKRRH